MESEVRKPKLAAEPRRELRVTGSEEVWVSLAAGLWRLVADAALLLLEYYCTEFFTESKPRQAER